MASIMTRPNGSGQAIGTRSATAPLRNADFSESLISPTYSTSGVTINRRISASKYSLSTLSTLAAILSGTPQRCAMRIAWSIPFSGEMRPRKARYEGRVGCGMSSRSGRPWWTVRTHPAWGTGRRCESEIEISGDDENVRNTN